MATIFIGLKLKLHIDQHQVVIRKINKKIKKSKVQNIFNYLQIIDLNNYSNKIK